MVQGAKKYLILVTIECERPNEIVKEFLKNISSKVKILDITYVEYPT